ncbi:MAG: hypothetical protein WCJ18_02355 [Planctomycetota bacterium]
MGLRRGDRDEQVTRLEHGREQSSYPRKNWSSLWSKEVVATQTGAYLHRFQDIHDDRIGEIPSTWNMLDWMDETTKLIHYTNGGPWLQAYRNHPHADVWHRALEAMHASRRRKRAA